MNRRSFLAGSASLAGLLALRPALGGEVPANPRLTGGYAPVQDELDVPELPVRGEIPAALRGVYLRNGPNPAFEPRLYVWPFDGDGMIHALDFDDRRVGYRNRFVMTRGLVAERRAGRALYGSLMAPVPVDPALIGEDGDPSPIKNLANTNVIAHGGRILALWEGGKPYELAPSLETRGMWDLAGALPRMTAHPKIDPETGELVAFAYSGADSILELAVFDPSGRVIRRGTLDMGRSYMVHDFAITERHLVFILVPVLLNIADRPPISWRPELGTRIAVMPRDLSGARWFDAEPFFMFHPLNGYETGDRIVVDLIRHADFAMRPVPGRKPPHLARASIDLAGGSVRLSALDDRASEFPRVDPRRLGRAHEHGWWATRTLSSSAAALNAIGHRDEAKDRIEVHDFGPGAEVDEPAFVPDPVRGPQAGFILTYVWDRATDSSRLAILDALDIAAPPVAEILLPRRVPHGLHGNWIAA